MRAITTHQTNEANKAITVELAHNEDGEPYCYTIGYDTTHHVTGAYRAEFNLWFQHGPIREAGVNGITNEVLLAIVQDRLEYYRLSPYDCDENRKACFHVIEALAWLEKRTRAREARGVEGTHTP